MKELRWLMGLVMGLTIAWPAMSLSEEQKPTPAAVEDEEQDYPIITDEDYPYLEEDTLPTTEEPASQPTRPAPSD